jgi:hypothetical protein
VHRGASHVEEGRASHVEEGGGVGSDLRITTSAEGTHFGRHGIVARTCSATHPEMDGFRTLGVGQHVEFEVVQGDRGPQGIHVVPLSPAPGVSAPYARRR